MKNNAVLIIGGNKEITDEEFDRRIINQMYTLCVIKNKKELNLEQFREEIKHRINKEDASIHEILLYFDSLSIEEKEELIDECSIELTEKKKENNGIPTLNDIDFSKPKEFVYNPLFEDRYNREEIFNNFIKNKVQKKKRGNKRW